MLKHPAEFPHAGSNAFLAPGADPARIIRRNEADGTALIALLPCHGATRAEQRSLASIASGNTTVDLAKLFATPGEALGLPPAGKSRRRTAR